MRWFTILRLLIAVLLLVFAIGFIRLAVKLREKPLFILSTCTCPLASIRGDYNGNIFLNRKVFEVSEAVSFHRDSLVSFLVKPLKDGGAGYDRRRLSDSIWLNQLIEVYIGHLRELKWSSRKSRPDEISLERTQRIALEMDPFEVSKMVSIPILFTSTETGSNKKLTGGGLINDSVRKVVYDGQFAYTLSEKSKILLKARAGIVQRVFPKAEPTQLVDADDNEVFVFDSKLIGNSFSELGVATTTVNVEVVNPLYNNVLGEEVRKWSAAKIISWTLITLIALFADKIKSTLLEPVVGKVFGTREKPQKRTTIRK